MFILMVAVGGAIGSVVRYLITLFCVNYVGNFFPFGTLIVNVIGSFFIGLCLSSFDTSALILKNWQPFIVVGVLGGLTTFSAFSFDTLALLVQQEYGKALLNVFLNIGLAFTAVYAGYLLPR